MLRKESEAVSEGNGPVHQEEQFGFGQPAPADVQSVRTLGVRDRDGTSRLLFGQKTPDVFQR